MSDHVFIEAAECRERSEPASPVVKEKLSAIKKAPCAEVSAMPLHPDMPLDYADKWSLYEAEDDRWKGHNLRARGDELVLDLANVLRIFERHPDFSDRFLYARGMGKVLDRGTVLLDWQIYALAAEIQERFLPGVSESLVLKGLLVAANRAREAKEAFL